MTTDVWSHPELRTDGVIGVQAVFQGRHCNRRSSLAKASYYLWRSKFGGMSVSDAKRLKELETENTRLKKLLAESLLENEVTREALRRKW
jgi:putative transposase